MVETTSAPSLRELSEAASSGHGKNDLWFTNDTTPWILGPEADGETDRFHVVARMPAIRRVDTDARRQWLRDRMFIVALVNAFRAGRLIDPTTLTEAVAAARAETEAMATMLADCVAVLQAVPLNQLPGKVDMMLFAALDAPIQGDASRSQLAERATAIRDTRDAAARAEGVAAERERTAPIFAALEEAAIWHDAQAKTLSKQPPGGDRDWRRMEHAEQAEMLRAIPLGVALTPGGRTDG